MRPTGAGSLPSLGREIVRTRRSLYRIWISTALAAILSKSFPHSNSISRRVFRVSSTIGSCHMLHLHQLLWRAYHRRVNPQSLVYSGEYLPYSGTRHVFAIPGKQIVGPVPHRDCKMKMLLILLLRKVDCVKVPFGPDSALPALPLKWAIRPRQPFVFGGFRVSSRGFIDDQRGERIILHRPQRR